MRNPPPSMDSKHFRNALGAFATGVTIVTTRADDESDVGLTANSFNSVSLDPPMVLWSLAKTAASLPVFMGSGHFAVHILASDQQPLSDRFAKRGIDKFEGVDFARGHGNVPLLRGCSASFQCRTAYRYEGGDHIIFVGEVLEFEHSAKQPLLFHSGGYGKILPRPKPADSAVPEIESSFRKDFLGYLLAVAATQLHRPVQARYSALGLRELEYYVITILAAHRQSTRSELDAVLAVGANRLSDEVLARLVDAGLVSVSGPGAEAAIDLTSIGREHAIQLFAVAKATEEEAAEVLDIDEARLLKQLLKRLIRGQPGSGVETSEP